MVKKTKENKTPKVERKEKKSSLKTKKKVAKIVHKSKEKTNGWIFPVIVLVLILIIGGIYYFYPESKGSDLALVEVNGEIIYQSQLDELWNSLPIDVKAQVTRDVVLDELVSQRLLMQKVEENNITVSDEEVAEYMEFELSQANMTLAQFEEILEAQGSSIETLEQIYREKLELASLFDNYVLTDLEVSDEEIQSYYESNQDAFIKDENGTIFELDELAYEGTEITVYDVVERVLMQEKAKAVYDSYVVELKEQSEIKFLVPITGINDLYEETNLTGEKDLASFANCLTESGAKFYGAYWCSHCNTQKEGFGESAELIPYVECDQNGPNSQVELCSEAGITGFPTWIINGEKYMGRQSHEELAKLTGCKL